MTGPRQLSPALALAALLLLPACAPRQPIASDPPDMRTEAQVRGQNRVAVQDVVVESQQAAPQPAAKPAPQAQPKAAAKPADVKAEAKPVEAKIAEVKPETAKVEAAAEAKVEPKAAEVKSGAKPEAKVAANSIEVKTEPKAEAAKPAPPTPSAQAEAAQKLDAAQAAAAQAVAAPRTAMVQIASFTTEKNAQGALAWLREKGYAEARVVRVEQGPAVFHRVQAGPFQDLAAARKALEELKAQWPQAFIPAD